MIWVTAYQISWSLGQQDVCSNVLAKQRKLLSDVCLAYLEPSTPPKLLEHTHTHIHTYSATPCHKVHPPTTTITNKQNEKWQNEIGQLNFVAVSD